jgi:hypothetical protein
VPLEYRLLWGFLAREGMREGEATGLTWSCLDLDRGAIRLDVNKTDDPRTWALNPGVAAALRQYREAHRPDDEPDDLVFLDPDGEPITGDGLADILREHLVTLGLKEERPELFTTTADRMRIRVHDLRGTFVTVSLANGRSESWISDRTGHKSSQMIATYKRNARTFAELDLGALAPLNVAIPELALPSDCPEDSAAEVSNPSAAIPEVPIATRDLAGSHLRELNSRPTVYEIASAPSDHAGLERRGPSLGPDARACAEELLRDVEAGRPITRERARGLAAAVLWDPLARTALSVLEADDTARAVSLATVLAAAVLAAAVPARRERDAAAE